MRESSCKAAARAGSIPGHKRTLGQEAQRRTSERLARPEPPPMFSRRDRLPSLERRSAVDALAQRSRPVSKLKLADVGLPLPNAGQNPLSSAVSLTPTPTSPQAITAFAGESSRLAWRTRRRVSLACCLPRHTTRATVERHRTARVGGAAWASRRSGRRPHISEHRTLGAVVAPTLA